MRRDPFPPAPSIALALLLPLAAGADPGLPQAHSAAPEPVSPAGRVELACPTFSWSAAAGAPGYELVVYAVAEDGEVGEEPLLSTRLPGGASSWTPAGSRCLAPGGRFAWSLRVPGDGAESPWSAPKLFQVAAAPSLGEVQAAIDTLRRYVAESRDRPAEGPDRGPSPSGGERPEASPRLDLPRRALPAPPSPPGSRGGTGALAEKSAPTLGAPSLSVDGNVALGADGNLFKGGQAFLWNDTLGNTALGTLALDSGGGYQNTAIGAEALRDVVWGYNTAVGNGALRSTFSAYGNTAVGAEALAANYDGVHQVAIGWKALAANTTGSHNTAVGSAALENNLAGINNTATGVGALHETVGNENTAFGTFAAILNTTGTGNTGIGSWTLVYNTEGSRNVALGHRAGFNATTGDDNVFILNEGVAGDAGKIRIGTEGTQGETFIAGIYGATVSDTTDLPVLIDDSGKLGVASSSRRFKQDVAGIGDSSERLLELRPVRFRYTEQAPEDPERYGLIAEEVAEVFPELVVDDREGRPYTVRYHLLVPLLLNELQRTRRDLDEARATIAGHQEELEALREQVAAP